ncbi:hypothetical protein Tco_0881868 [Tanacetum coccineum]
MYDSTSSHRVLHMQSRVMKLSKLFPLIYDVHMSRMVPQLVIIIEEEMCTSDTYHTMSFRELQKRDKVCTSRLERFLISRVSVYEGAEEKRSLLVERELKLKLILHAGRIKLKSIQRKHCNQFTCDNAIWRGFVCLTIIGNAGSLTRELDCIDQCLNAGAIIVNEV